MTRERLIDEILANLEDVKTTIDTVRLTRPDNARELLDEASRVLGNVIDRIEGDIE